MNRFNRWLLAGGLLGLAYGISVMTPVIKGAPAPRNQINPLPIGAAPDASIAAPVRSCESMRQAVVTLYAGREIGTGSVVRSDGLVLTSHHVVNRLDDGWVRAKTAMGERLVGQIVAVDREHDLALIQLNAQTALPTLPLAPLDQVQPGTTVCAIGSPFGRSGILTRGTLTHVLSNGNLQSLLRLHPGDSGGPLLNAQGELIGVNRSIWESSRGENTGISFATSLAIAKPLIEQHPTIAVRNDPPPTSGPAWDLPDSPLKGTRLGVMLDRQTLTIEVVEPGSPADRAGLSTGDRLIAIDGNQLGSLAELQQFLDRQPDAARLTVDRNQRREEVQVMF